MTATEFVVASPSHGTLVWHEGEGFSGDWPMLDALNRALALDYVDTIETGPAIKPGDGDIRTAYFTAVEVARSVPDAELPDVQIEPFLLPEGYIA